MINFGTQEEYEALLQAQAESVLVGSESATPPAAEPAAPETAPEPEAETGRPSLRRAVEEFPRQAQ